MIVVMLAALQVWRARGSFWPLALGLLASITDPPVLVGRLRQDL
jgi:hypothetical protein